MDISVIIPVYNVEPFITECLDSLYAQRHLSGVSIEAIIIDDRGTDNSMAIVRKYLAEHILPFDTHIIEHSSNRGLSAARNSGIRNATGKYVYLLDSDDILAPDCLSTLWSEVTAHPDVDIVYGYTEYFPDTSYMKEYFAPTRNITATYLAGTEYKRLHFEINVLATNRLIRRQMILAHNLFFKEGIIHEDYLWHYMAFEHIRSVALPADKTPTYHYRQRCGSITSESTGDKRTANMMPVHDVLFEHISHTSHIGFTLLWNLMLAMDGYRQTKEFRGIYRRYWHTLYRAQSIGWRHRIVLLYHRLPLSLRSFRILYRLNKYLVKD